MDEQQIHDLIAEADGLLASGDKAGALSRFQLASRLDPRSENAWLGIARTTDDNDEAVRALGQVMMLNPSNVEARERRLALQMYDLRAGMSSNAYRENPLERFGRPLLALAGVALLIALLFFGKDPVLRQVQAWTVVESAPPPPTLQALVLPPTWTPLPSLTPTATATPTEKPKVVMGRIAGTATLRTGPGQKFGEAGTLTEPTEVVLTARSEDGKYYQLHQVNDGRLAWTAVEFVSIVSGDPNWLPVLRVPTPTPVPVTPTKKPVYRPPPPTPTPSFTRSKFVPNPYGPRCDRTYVQGTVWSDWRQEPHGAIGGVLVRVWVNGAIYATDTSGSHGPANRNPGYWEVNFPLNQPVRGLVAVVAPDGKLLSPQYEFVLTGGNCHEGSTINEIIIDFSH